MHDLDTTVALLARTPSTLDALLRDLPDAWTRRDEGGDTWSAFETVGHLIHGERTDWLPRTKLILESGESRPFDPFDRWGYVKEVEGKTLAQLLDTFSSLRTANLDELRVLHLSEADLEKRGLHPEFGPVTLGQMLATWAAHDLTHLHQITRIMAHQYREAVGPWTRYLGVLQCNGHG